MEIEFDEDKRQKTLDERGLDFRDTGDFFKGVYFTREDGRKDYGEIRYISVGMIGPVVVVVVWTERYPRRRIISMRKADIDERGEYFAALD